MSTDNIKSTKRSKLLVFSSVSFVVLTVGFLYLELYNPYEVPTFIRIVLALYWLYSIVAMVVSMRGSDKFVSKMCLNIFRRCGT